MTLIEIAQIYTELVAVDNAIPESEFNAKDEVTSLRSRYHQMFMDKLREEGIEFGDRFEAMNIAFEIVKKESLATNLLHPRALSN
jgi:hypothetical protein